MLLLNGDYDWSTAVENAEHTSAYLKTGHLLEIHGGTHCTDTDEMPDLLPGAFEQAYAFVDADFSHSSPQKFFSTLPDSVAYPALAFEAPAGPSLYEQWLARRRSR